MREVTCPCINKTIPESIIKKIATGEPLSDEEGQWIIAASENECETCVKNLPFAEETDGQEWLLKETHDKEIDRLTNAFEQRIEDARQECADKVLEWMRENGFVEEVKDDTI